MNEYMKVPDLFELKLKILSPPSLLILLWRYLTRLLMKKNSSLIYITRCIYSEIRAG